MIHRIKRHNWNKGEIETKILYKSDEQYKWLKPFQFIPVEKNIGNVWFENYPYRWWEINYLWDIQSYYIQYFSERILKILRIIENNLIIKIIKIIIAIGEGILMLWGIAQIIKSLSVC